jgi:hypothetical protein
MTELFWVCVSGPGPEWQRSAALDSETDTVFMPAAATGNEQKASLCASFDGTSAVIDAGHIYLPTRWIASEYPDMADLCLKIEGKVREHFQLDSKKGEQ